MKRPCAITCMICFLWIAAPVHAADYPTKPVRIVVAYPAGGGDDLHARLVAEKLTQIYGKQFIVDNRPSAGGVLGFELVSKAVPDGYTLLLGGAAETPDPPGGHFLRDANGRPTGKATELGVHAFLAPLMTRGMAEFRKSNLLALFAQYAKCGLTLARISAADLVVMNKIDLVSDAQRFAIRAEIERRASGARVVETRYCSIPVAVLLGAFAETGAGQLRAQERGMPASAHAHDHHSTYQTFSWEHSAALDAERLRDALDRMPASILRAKGFVYVVQVPGERAVLHTVGRRSSLTRGGSWPEQPRTRLVFIGEASPGIREQVSALLESAIADRFPSLRNV